MQFRKLGKTGVDVSVIGLGAEHLEHAPKETVLSVVNEAMAGGVNYIDLFMASPNVRDHFGTALHGKRQEIMIAGHLGAAWKEEQYHRTRDPKMCLDFFHDLLTRLNTDYIDVLMLHFVDEREDYESVFGESGLLSLALSLKKEGKARFIGMSSHKVPVSLDAVNSGHLDVLMFPVNPAFDYLPGDTVLEAHWQENSYGCNRLDSLTPSFDRMDLYNACARHGVGIVAMKPYAAGWLFWKENPSSLVLSPEQCLHYSLSQSGVCTAVPGCKTVEEMKAALGYLEASEQQKDYASAISNSRWNLKERCMYCNHCLPCPSGIDIGAVTRMYDSASTGMTELLRNQYRMLAAKASDCIACGSCSSNCPFGVDVISNMQKTVQLFEK
jgi:uncharacterized protein